MIKSKWRFNKSVTLRSSMSKITTVQTDRNKSTSQPKYNPIYNKNINLYFDERQGCVQSKVNEKQRLRFENFIRRQDVNNLIITKKVNLDQGIYNEEVFQIIKDIKKQQQHNQQIRSSYKLMNSPLKQSGIRSSRIYKSTYIDQSNIYDEMKHVLKTFNKTRSHYKDIQKKLQKSYKNTYQRVYCQIRQVIRLQKLNKLSFEYPLLMTQGMHLFQMVNRADRFQLKYELSLYPKIVHYRDQNGQTLLQRACMMQIFEMVELLLKHNCDLEALDNVQNYRTALYLVFQYENEQLIALLFKHFANPWSTVYNSFKLKQMKANIRLMFENARLQVQISIFNLMNKHKRKFHLF